MLKMTTDQTCQKQYLDKSSAQHEIRLFFSTYRLFCCLHKIFSTYCTVFLKLPYRDIAAFCTKWNGWAEVVFDSLQASYFPLSRCDAEKHWWFSMPFGAINASQGKVPAFIASSYNGKVLVIRLNNAVFSCIWSSYVSSIIDAARTILTKAKFAWSPYQRLLL